MTITTTQVIIAVGFLIIGWVGHICYERFLDWLADMTGWAGSWMWDVFAVLGLATACVGIGFMVVNHH